MSERSGVVIIGMGPGGEEVAGRLLRSGRQVTVIERELIGGECAYWACIPSKTLLRPPEAQRAAASSAGSSRPEIDWNGLREYRDYMVRHLDDGAQIEEYENKGARVIKGAARLIAPGQLEVNGEVLLAEHVVIATGSRPVIPAIAGTDGDNIWTNREATGLSEIPARAVVVGGSAVGIELGLLLAAGMRGHARAASDAVARARGAPRVSELVEQHLVAASLDLRVGRSPRLVRQARDGSVVELDDGSMIETDVIVLATGRRPNVEGLGLETAGVEVTANGGIAIDDHGRAAPGVWAVGDVTNIAMFTHVAMYHGRIVADNILGRERVADYDGVPRVVFSDPEIAAVGLTSSQATERGIATMSAEIELADSIARPWTYETDPDGVMGVLLDRSQQRLIGAWAVAPLASEWIHQASLAIRARIPLDVLLDQIPQFPTYSEAYLKALESLR